MPRQSDDAFGLGVGIQSDPATGERAELTLRRGLVAGNRDRGVFALGATAAIEETVVRDTMARQSDEKFGWGLDFQDDPATGERSEATLGRGLVARNRELGVFVTGSTVVLAETVVRDTAPRQSDDQYCWGIEIRNHPATGERAEVMLVRDLVADNREVGVAVSGSTAAFEETIVRDTLPRQSDQRFGRGISIQADPATGERAEMTLVRELVARNREVSVYVSGSAAVIEETIVRDTALQELDETYGDDIQAYGDVLPSRLDVAHCAVLRSKRAGVLFYGAEGSLVGSVSRGNVFAVALDQGAMLKVGNDNLFADNERNDVATGQGLTPAPPLEALDLSDLSPSPAESDR